MHPLRRYKTDPAVYALGPQAFGVPAREILFVSSNGWDAIGATWYGYTTLWVNRGGLPPEELDTEPTRTGTSLRDVLSFFEQPEGDNNMSIPLPQGVQINAPILPGFETILTPPALELVAKLHRSFQPRRKTLLAARAERAKRLDAGERPDFPAETKAVREGDWKIAPIPQALHCRRVEITGPVDAKMVINAFNSGADSYMTDFEDSNSPKWDNQIQGQINIGQRDPPHAHARGGRQELQAQRQDRDAAGAPARLAPRRETRAGRWRARFGRPVRLRAVHVPQREGAARARRRAVLLPAEDGKPPRGATVERRVRDDAKRARAVARHDQGDGADRDDPRGVRDGRDPL